MEPQKEKAMASDGNDTLNTNGYSYFFRPNAPISAQAAISLSD